MLTPVSRIWDNRLISNLAIASNGPTLNISLRHDDYKLEKLFKELIDFKYLSDSELSSAAWEDFIVRDYDDGSEEYRINTLW